jgi:hypothetical protein
MKSFWKKIKRWFSCDVIERPITPTPDRDKLIDGKWYSTEHSGSLRDRFNRIRSPHYNRTSWEYHEYEQKTYGKCSYTANCIFCEKIKNGEPIMEVDKIDAMTFL